MLYIANSVKSIEQNAFQDTDFWQPSQSLILGPAHNQFGAPVPPIFGFRALQDAIQIIFFPKTKS